MHQLLTAALAGLLTIFLIALVLPGLAEAGCELRMMCEAGTGTNGVCTDSGSANIVTEVKKGGRHEASIVPSATDAVCTVNVKKAVGGYTADYSTQVGQMSCNSVDSIALEGPADSVWFEIVDNPIAGSNTITGYLMVCD